MSTFLFDSAGERWNVGSAELLLQHPFGSHTLQTAVRCRVEGINEPVVALLDTGSSHTIVGGPVAERLWKSHRRSLRQAGELGSRLGYFDLHAGIFTITLLNEGRGGSDLPVGVDVRLALGFPLELVLGVNGMLDHVRIALDPGVALGDARWYFGPAGGP